MHDLPNGFRMTELGPLPEGWVQINDGIEMEAEKAVRNH